MQQADVDKLLQGRAIVDAYRAEHTKGKADSVKLTEDIHSLGFASIDNFFEFNDEMCIAAIKEFPIYGECDHCRGYAGTPKCKITYGDSVCISEGVNLTEKNLKTALLFRARGGSYGIPAGWKGELIPLQKVEAAKNNGIFWCCPEGHGFYLKPLEIIPSKFSITWK